MYCEKCGAEVKESNQFCERCGNKIQWGDSNAERGKREGVFTLNKEKKRSKKFLVCGGIAAAVILFGAIFGSDVLGNDGRKPDKNFPSISDESAHSKTFDFKVDRAWATDTIKCPKEERGRFDSKYLSPMDENAIFYIVEFTFTNTSDQPIDERPSIHLVDSAGVTYERDEEVTMYTKSGGTSPDYSVYDEGVLSEPMAPGLSLKGQCTFVIAKDRLDENGCITCSRSQITANSAVEWLTGINFGAEESVSVPFTGQADGKIQTSDSNIPYGIKAEESPNISQEVKTTEYAIAPDTGNTKAGEEKPIPGVYKLEFGNEGGAELEIAYESGSDLFSASFAGSYADAAGNTTGTLSAYTDGTNGVWQYYPDEQVNEEESAPSMQLEYNGADTIIVKSLDGQSFGGMKFPGFAGTYTRTGEAGYNGDIGNTDNSGSPVYSGDYGDTANNNENEYVIPESSMVDLSTSGGSYLMTMEPQWLRIAKNEIYARHGRKFGDSELQNYFNSKSWYHGYIEPEDFNADVLSEIEKSNINFLDMLYQNAVK